MGVHIYTRIFAKFMFGWHICLYLFLNYSTAAIAALQYALKSETTTSCAPQTYILANFQRILTPIRQVPQKVLLLSNLQTR